MTAVVVVGTGCDRRGARGVVTESAIDGTNDLMPEDNDVDVWPQPIRFEPIRLAWAEALIEGDAIFTDRFGISVEPGWTGFPEALPILLGAARDKQADPRWGPQLFFDSDGSLVGNGGWKGRPDNGVAELGYAVAPSRQGRGIATYVVRHLIDYARREGLTVVVAHTLAEENASTKVLSRCGFARTEELNDPDEGRIWRWELALRPPDRV